MSGLGTTGASTIARRDYNCWALIWRSKDVPGQWVAHCLNFDIVSQGDSAGHAFQMIQEAVGLTVADDLNNDRDPDERRAPSDCWAPLHELFEIGVRLAGSRDINKYADAHDSADNLVLAVNFAMAMTRAMPAERHDRSYASFSRPPDLSPIQIEVPLSLLALEASRSGQANC